MLTIKEIQEVVSKFTDELERLPTQEELNTYSDYLFGYKENYSKSAEETAYMHILFPVTKNFFKAKEKVAKTNYRIGSALAKTYLYKVGIDPNTVSKVNNLPLGLVDES